jgi:hypothetical protein
MILPKKGFGSKIKTLELNLLKTVIGARNSHIVYQKTNGKPI